MQKRIFSSLMSNFSSKRIKILQMAEATNNHLQNPTGKICYSSKNTENSQGKSCEAYENHKPTVLKKRLKRKLQNNGITSNIRIRPNYFVAVQVSDHTIHDKINTIQEHMLQQDNRLEQIMIDPSTLHITLMVMHIKDEETHARALNALHRVHEEFNETMCNDPVTMDFSGLGHFGNKVLYTKVKESNSLNRLKTLAEKVERHFAEENILSTDRRGFNPHLTIAKIRFDRHGTIKKIDPSLYKDFLDDKIGSQTIKGIQLLSMTDPKDEKGYYTGDELLFSL